MKRKEGYFIFLVGDTGELKDCGEYFNYLEIKNSKLCSSLQA